MKYWVAENKERNAFFVKLRQKVSSELAETDGLTDKSNGKPGDRQRAGAAVLESWKVALSAQPSAWVMQPLKNRKEKVDSSWGKGKKLQVKNPFWMPACHCSVPSWSCTSIHAEKSYLFWMQTTRVWICGKTAGSCGYWLLFFCSTHPCALYFVPRQGQFPDVAISSARASPRSNSHDSPKCYIWGNTRKVEEKNPADYNENHF